MDSSISVPKTRGGNRFSKENQPTRRRGKSRANQLMDQLFTPNPDDVKVIRDRLISEAKAGTEWAILAVVNRLWPARKGAGQLPAR